MNINNFEELLKCLLDAYQINEYSKILESIGDIYDIELNKKFGPFNLEWHPFGNKISNVSSIGLGTKAARSLTERLTNRHDAILEARAIDISGTLPTSPRKAAEKWFGRPISGPDTGLFTWDYSTGQYDKYVNVVLLESGVENAPTIDVIDKGIGLKAEEFSTTILSLQEGNKIQKNYLIGAFGQGGASTL